MNAGLVAVFSLLVVMTLSLLIVRIAAVALVLTGVSRPLARFQARSAFTGVGFTTAESEKIVNHPVRRRIIMTLMFLGPPGIIATAGSLVIGLVSTGEGATALWIRLVLIFAGVGLLLAISYSQFVDRQISRLTFWALRKYTDLELRDYANLMHLTESYGIVEMAIETDNWLTDEPLEKLQLSREGVLVLGITRADGTYVGVPRGRTMLHAGDTVILYGHTDRLRELDERRRGIGGHLAHADAVAEAEIERDEEERADMAAAATAPPPAVAAPENRRRNVRQAEKEMTGR